MRSPAYRVARTPGAAFAMQTLILSGLNGELSNECQVSCRVGWSIASGRTFCAGRSIRRRSQIGFELSGALGGSQSDLQERRVLF